MFQFAFRLSVLIGLIVVSAAVLAAAPDERDAAANAGWEEIGVGSASGGGISINSTRYPFESPAVAIGADGAPVVAWTHLSFNESDIYVRRWNGSAWVELGSGSASNGGISNNGASGQPALAIGPDGAPIVAWTDGSGSDYSDIYVRRWNGSSWVEMSTGSASGGGISNTDHSSYAPSLAIGGDGALIVAWTDASGGERSIYLRRWDGSAWAELGVGSASGRGISPENGWFDDPSLALDAIGSPVVAWTDYTADSTSNSEIQVRRWNGSEWLDVGVGSTLGGGISFNGGKSEHPSLAIGPDNAPTVAWSDNSSGNFEIYVRRWNGSDWVEMGTGSASGGGISDSSGWSESPVLTIGYDGTPVITWESDITGNSEIYVRQWNGSTWDRMGSHSALGGGISDNPLWSHMPSLAVGYDGTPIVAWYDGIGNEHHIYVRRYPPCNPSWHNSNGQQAISGFGHSASPHTLFLPSVLHVLQSYFAGPFELEPNNAANEANGLLCSSRDYTGLPNDRYDVFSLDAGPGLMTVELTNHVGAGVQLQVHYQTITTRPMGFDTNGEDGYRIIIPDAPVGRYYIIISTLTPYPGTTTRYTLTPTFTMSP